MPYLTLHIKNNEPLYVRWTFFWGWKFFQGREHGGFVGVREYKTLDEWKVHLAPYGKKLHKTGFLTYHLIDMEADL